MHHKFSFITIPGKFILVLSLLLYCSCRQNKRPVTLRIKFECFPSTVVDTLSNVLLSNSYSDFSGGGGFNLFSAKRVYVKNLKRSTDSCFYLHDIEKSTYEYIYLEGFVDNALFKAYKRKLDFSKTSGDTAEVVVCFEPNMKILSQ